jgi:acyl-CoA reductase-like NAD-dependent aldehyde dehydrogenase
MSITGEHSDLHILIQLGGKSPVIVDNTIDLKMTARRLLWGKTANAGQVCALSVKFNWN